MGGREELPRVVLDNGSGFLKAGFSGQSSPKVTFPSCVGQLRKRQHATFVGDQCFTLPEYFCHRPFSNGLVVDPDLLRDVWDKALGKGYLNCSPEERSICLTEAYLTPAAIRHTISEILFEDFEFKRMLICPSPAVVPYGFWGLLWGQLDILQKGTTSLGLPEMTCYGGPLESYSAIPCAENSSFSFADVNINSASIRNGGKICSYSVSNPSLMVHQSYSNIPSPCILSNEVNSKDKRQESMPLIGACNIDPNFVSPPKKLRDVTLSNRSSRNPCSLVVDCGFSRCEVMPFFEYQPIERGALRTDLGGQHLNAYLKNLVSYRSMNLEQNELLIQHMKEECCYVSQDFISEMKMGHYEMKNRVEGRNRRYPTHLHCEYILPDYSVKNKNLLLYFFNSHGKSTFCNSNTDLPPLTQSSSQERSPESVMHRNDKELLHEVDEKMDSSFIEGKEISERAQGFSAFSPDTRQNVLLSNERISVPEILFNPRDTGSSECSLPELIYRSISLAPVELQPFLAQQILLVGGTSKLRGLKERLWIELRALFPSHWPIYIYQHLDPANSVWVGASQWAQDETVFSMFATTKEYFRETGNLKGNNLIND